jgi:hypothetical protein
MSQLPLNRLMLMRVAAAPRNALVTTNVTTSGPGTDPRLPDIEPSAFLRDER